MKIAKSGKSSWKKWKLLTLQTRQVVGTQPNFVITGMERVVSGRFVLTPPERVPSKYLSVFQ